MRGSERLRTCLPRPIAVGELSVCGAEVVSRRVALEQAMYVVQKQTFGALDSAYRHKTFTAHPSVTPGLYFVGCLLQIQLDASSQ